MAKLMSDYYKADNISWGRKITVEVEDYKSGRLQPPLN